MDEIRTTVSLPPSLHLWLRQYALVRRMSFRRLVVDILLEWAKSKGYTDA